MWLKLLPVDEMWVHRMITLAGVAWERAMVEALFVQGGLALAGERVEWEGGQGAPQFAVDADGQWKEHAAWTSLISQPQLPSDFRSEISLSTPLA